MNICKKIRRLLCLWSVLLTAIPAMADEYGLKIRALNDQVYLHTSYHKTESYGWVGAHGLVVIDETNAYVIDTPWSESDTAKLVQWIGDKDLQLVGSVSTHFHDDRTAGIAYLNAQGIPTHASHLTNQLLAEVGKPLASHGFTDRQFSWLPGGIEVYYPGAGHSKDNVVVWLPEQKLLFGGCLIRSIHSKTLGNTSDAVVSEWGATAAHVLANFAEVKTVVPGHGSIGGVELIHHTIQLAKQQN